MTNITELFGRQKLSKKERREMRKIELERMQNKIQIARLSSIYQDRKTKMKMVKRIEKTPGFQQDLRRMKEMFMTKPIMNDKINPLKPPKTFFKSNTDMELKGFDKQYKKKDFLML